MSDAMRSHGLPAALGPVEVAHGRVQRYHVDWALARPNISWQHRAAMLKVNAADLKHYCLNPHLIGRPNDGLPQALPPPARDIIKGDTDALRARPKTFANRVKPGSVEHSVLLAVSDGLTTTDLIAERVERGLKAACACIYVLIRKEFLASERRLGLSGNARQLSITTAGLIELDRIARGMGG